MRSMTSTTTTRAGRDGGRPYHHGDLPAALLEAALQILERDGIAGLTLRAVARRAGVSHMAPAHHFGDLGGLLSELAALGFRRFGGALGEAAGPDRLDAMGEAYVAFARANPALFLLMFRSERLDPARPSLADALARASTLLTQAAGGFVAGEEQPTLAQVADAVRAWSMVHGFAMLLLDGRLDATLSSLSRHDGVGAEALLRAVLRAAASGATPPPPDAAPR